MLAETVVEAARRFGERPALVAEDGWSLSYRDVDRVSDETAAALSARGITEGDVVALVLPPTAEHYVAYLAAAKLGAITASVNSRLTAAERDALLSVSRPSLVVATAELSPASLPTGADAVTIEEARGPEGLCAALRVAGGVPPPLAPDPDRPVAIVFTSGTTGLPKGALFGGRQFAFITDTDVGPDWGGGGDVLAGSVLSHLGPMTKLAGSLRRGNTQHLCRTWKAADALARTRDLKVGVLAGVPTQIALMLRMEDFDSYDLSALRAILMGGGPATPALVAEARSRFGVPIMVRYSCTEAGIGTGTGIGDPAEDAEQTVGRPQPGVRIEVVGADGEALGTGEIGEVCLASPATMDGYWQDPDATAAAFTGRSAVKTGDLGFVDDLGRLHLSGRRSDRYVRGGYNVHPMEVEAVLSQHESVRSIAVVGRPDPVMGEVGVAVVVADPTKPACDLSGLRTFGESRLARYKLPDELLFVDELPLTAGDKVDRRQLAATVASSGRLSGEGPGSSRR